QERGKEEIGGRVEYEEDGEARRVRGRGDQPRRRPADPESQVHRHPLEAVARVAPRLRRQIGEERRLARPEAAVPESDERRERVGVPGRTDEREPAEAGGE